MSEAQVTPAGVSAERQLLTAKSMARQGKQRSSIFKHGVEVGHADYVHTLKATFDLIDTDGSGSIDHKEFGCLLRLQGEDVTDEDAKGIMEEIDVDGDATNITYDEFVKIMEDIRLLTEHQTGKGTNKFDLASAFANRAKDKSSVFQAKDPLFMRMQRAKEKAEIDGVSFSKTQNARMALAGVVDGNWSQVVILTLVVLDVVCVLCELLLLATKCPCTDKQVASMAYGYGSAYSSYGSAYGGSAYGSSYGDSSYSSSYSSSSYGSSYGDSSYSRRLDGFDELEPEDEAPLLDYILDFMPSHFSRRLAGGEFCPEATSPITGEKERFMYSWEQNWYHHWLSVMSISILWIFATQVGMLMIIYGLDFFKNMWYVLDLIVVAGALILELAIKVTGGPLFTLLLSWRFFRVAHGLLTSMELTHKREHDKVKQLKAKTLQFIVGTRRAGAAKHMYFRDFHDMLKKQYGVVSMDKKRYHAEAHRTTFSQKQLSLLPSADGTDDVHAHSAEGHKLEEAMSKHHTADFSERVEKMETAEQRALHAQHEKEDVEELMAELAAKEMRRKAAESMFVEIYAHLDDHHENLKDHTDGLNSHDHDEGGHH
mmetsp:Transcript_856/g.1574  ORF Transcript_856/g.1574 Transcript_856/m.1574 type:complete len:597 (+) Transcript_856:390-2180(+)|eukprot:CAMPEP_0119483078 /NCGR_PEP_ID=MMETSP1344-20130328/10649_1 /TAXON_ID=236787 /ORGANISM="Florenciella parvula, Strain CCMP2471" /LENGTH=596 /DNA_ID=CAMNT_0007517545 /DNA_START=390 /DNA_END=2180 /DNA_ORIENTATION=-